MQNGADWNPRRPGATKVTRLRNVPAYIPHNRPRDLPLASSNARLSRTGSCLNQPAPGALSDEGAGTRLIHRSEYTDERRLTQRFALRPHIDMYSWIQRQNSLGGTVDPRDPDNLQVTHSQ